MFVLSFTTELSFSQSVSEQVCVQELQPELIDYDYLRVAEITGWDIEVAKYFVTEARIRNVSVFEEALPILTIETGNTYGFDLVNKNTNGTCDKGLFQINDLTYKDVVRMLKEEGREFNSWSRLDFEFNVAAGLCWIAFLKEQYGLEEDSLFTSYNRGVSGAKYYASRNGTYETEYSRKVQKAKEEIIKLLKY